ncbi:MAG: lipocalin-like domain-containing protein [Desulfobacca sp.]|uniref:lipocalin-like domain-containing protein n=1 Tax=Desulfobacca sp. TaxID=2067990 RepID=UPI00404965D3
MRAVSHRPFLWLRAARQSFCRPVLAVSLPILILILGLSLVSPVLAQQEFRLALPGWQYVFPRDHAAHPDFKTEWWYYTGHLTGEQGEPFSFQLTFFRVGVRRPDPKARSAWSLHTLYFAHLALTDIQGRRFVYHEKVGRGALGMSGAAVDRYQVWIDHWQAELQGEMHQLRAATVDLSLELHLTPTKPPVSHGHDGVSQKAAGEGFASHYYSLTRLATQGTLHYRGHTYQVRGQSWMDHEFSSSQLAPYQTGWDWFSLQLDDGHDLMLYVLRHQDGSPDPFSSGTLVDPQGQGRHLQLADFAIQSLATWQSPKSGAVYPAAWKISLPGHGYELEIRPTLPDQELITSQSTQITYWEGSVRISGTKNGRPVAGQGYVELTGYAGALGGRF